MPVNEFGAVGASSTGLRVRALCESGEDVPCTESPGESP